MKNNPLFDAEFLKHLDNYRNRTVYVRILSLTTDGYPIEQIEGVATGGTITIDGSSAVRRICSLTMTTQNININNIYWGLNARVKIEVGLERKFDIGLDSFANDFELLIERYEEYPDVIWFPQGVFIITEFKTNSQINNYTITLTGKDKMCLLNGDVGGVFNAETDIGTEQYWDDNIKRYVKEKKSLQYVIQEMIHHYAKEDYGNIIVKLYPGYDILQNRTGSTIYIIEDKDEQPVDVRSSNDVGPSGYYWAGSHYTIDFSNMRKDFIYHFSADEDNNTLISGQVYALPTTIVDDNDNEYMVRRILDKDDLGYQIHELDFPDDLIAAPGNTVTSILDKIIQHFPAYEYFYNLYGQFVFQPKDTYVNTSWNNEISYENEKFILPMAVSKKVKYSFEGNQIITAFQNNPKLNEIKNDFTVWGLRTLPSGIQQHIHMRYAIDRKPNYYVSFKKEDSEKSKLYITKEYYEELQDNIINAHKETWLEKKTKPPQYLLDAQYYSYENYISDRKADLIPIKYTQEELNARWWDITEWAEYYKEMFGDYPDERLLNYGITGAIFSCIFPDGSIISVDRINRNNSGITMQYIPNGINSLERKSSLSSVFIFDTYYESGNPFFTQIPGTSMIWNPFQHGFNGCYHYFLQFLNRSLGVEDNMTKVTEPNFVKSWIYNPQVPKSKLDEHQKKIQELKTQYEIKIVDWREIIYQMALDYYALNHDDNFHLNLFHNNDLTEFNVPRIYSIDGRTGYEQYYHDIEGFWRTLYVPLEEREQYFSIFRKLTGMQHELPASIMWGADNTTFTYNSALRDQTIHVDALSEEKTEFYIDVNGNIRNYETDEILTDASCESGYTLQILIDRDLTIKATKEEIIELEQQLDEKYHEYNSAIQLYKVQSLEENDNIDQSTVENLKNEINALTLLLNQQYDAIQQAQLALCSYSLFYNCEVNEEDFYGDINYTPNGFPIYTDYTTEELSVVGEYNKNIVYNPQELLFWFDFYNPDSLGLGQFSVPAIGPRPKVKQNEAIKALIYQDVPDFIFVKAEDYEKDPTNSVYYDYKVIPLHEGDFYQTAIDNGDIRVSTRSITAQEEIDEMLYKDSYSNEEVQLTSIPVYYLEPNIIISARDELQIVNGYYILNKMVVPLTFNGTMKNTCVRVPERIY